MIKTKIICTIGPSTKSIKNLSKLLKEGMNIIRINLSHGTHKEHEDKIKAIRYILLKTKRYASIMLDTKGPEIRTMNLENGIEIDLTLGQELSLVNNHNITGNKSLVAITYKKLVKYIDIDNKILIDDGLIKLNVIGKARSIIKCKVLNNGKLGENKSINIPTINLKLPTLSEKDKKDIIFGCEQRLEYIAASFIRSLKDIVIIKAFVFKYKGEPIKLISKLENQEGLNNFNAILKSSYGIMIARGDLGVEIPIEEVILAQKLIINKCNQAKKPVITATQLLESMIENPRPTRAEAGDVANAILDGSDAVMLSGETAKGKYPIEAVKLMRKICNRTDNIMSLYLIR
ncbi:pyruvate kinase [Candidatus Tremblaya phenacola]|uniref:pyruvate kinase n=1 Tax=Candidatus Tremblayella phenacoccinincola TaxID=1010676 RepID=UPI00132FFA45|nr:pyruvate kinase [Candidatus Tremblaya phenacola]KAH0998192.1 Pyruvate kinase [Candidatus Tremblaya phenacola]